MYFQMPRLSLGKSMTYLPDHLSTHDHPKRIFRATGTHMIEVYIEAAGRLRGDVVLPAQNAAAAVLDRTLL